MNLEHIKQNVKWKDLVKLTPREKFIENTLCFPWLIASLVAAYNEYYLLALPCSAMYFLTSRRQSHNGYHNALGISQFWTRCTLYFNSTFMLASLHAIKHNHMKHHKEALSHEDYERRIAEMKWWRALVHGPFHWVYMHGVALKEGRRKEAPHILLELVLVLGLLTAAMGFQIHFLIYHMAFMILAECLLPFFTVWVVHHRCDEHKLANIQRSKVINFLTMNMMLHLEHHLFPAVPAIKLGVLSKRIDDFEVNRKGK
ncbi:MAG: fatty acid desaturase [Flavobacteriales bacterium]